MPSSAQPRTDGYFRHHGVWAPGVRMFRNMRFVGKAAVVSGLFLLVVMQTLGLFVHGALRGIDEARTERAGVVVQRHLMQALDAAIALRATATASQRNNGPMLATLAATLDKAQADAGSLAVSEPLKFVRQAAEPLDKPAASVDDAFAQADGLVQEMHRAMAAINTTSQLSHESDALARGLMTLATEELLDLQAAIGRVSELGSHALDQGEAGPASRRIVQGEGYIALRQVEELNATLEDLKKIDAAASEALRSADATDAVNHFLRLARRPLPAEGAGPGNGQPLRLAGREAQAQLRALSGRSLEALDGVLQARITSMQRQLGLQTGFVLACLLLAAYLFRCFYLVTQGGMQELRQHIERMADGDLHTTPRPWGKDEAADVLLAVDTMQQRLRELVGEVRSCADDIAAQSSQISDGSLDLTQRTELNSNRLQQSATSLETLAGLSRDSAQEVQRSAELGRAASTHAGNSQRDVLELVQRIEALHASSRRVGDIVGVIDGIAFQTNILALNAAVEAARAGESGRGFAVVASEVRALAQRSAQAAREIKTLVQQSQGEAASGTEAVHAAGASIEQLTRGVLTIGDALERLSMANSSQAQEVAEVAASISALDSDAQKNAAMVTEASVAASIMRDKAAHLALAASRFTL